MQVYLFTVTPHVSAALLRARQGQLLYDLGAKKHLISDTSVEKGELVEFTE